MKPNKKDTEKNVESFPIVGIGASAGGLDAFRKMLREIPEDSGMAYVIVQHLSPDYDSNLTEILQQVSKVPITEIIHDVDLRPNHVYVIPESNNVIAADGKLKLSKHTRGVKSNNIIDVFFGSLSEVYGTFAIGIVLSGTAFDGTIGLKKIREAGGVTIVQNPESAAFKAMPQSGIEADVVDYILNPNEIPGQLLKIRDSYHVNYGYTEEEHIPASEEDILNQITNLIFLRSGNDFRHYKQPTIRRRIARRMVLLRKETLQDYYNFLRQDKVEQDALFNDFLIPVTYFFRDHTIFDTLSNIVYPQLVKNADHKNLRIWVAGCSTGEEAYSLAISIYEYLSEQNLSDIRVQIFASDISEKCVSKARAGIYTAQDVQNISPTRLANYFIKRDGTYHMNKIIRDMCVFAVHNFLKDPPFAKIDMISCRNVMIYLDPYLQNKVLGSFHYSLREKGFLFLGKSESASGVQNLFENVGKLEKIYSRRFAPGRYVPEAFRPAAINLREKQDFVIEEKKIPETDFKKIASDILFSRYTPAGVVINDHQDIVHFHGDTGPFLQQSPGKPNFNVLKMAREGISFELRNALLRLKKEKGTIVRDNISVKNQYYLATIEVVPLDSQDKHVLVLFHKKDIPKSDIESKLTKKTTEQARIQMLENELAQMREDIKRVTEEQQTAYEELQTTNEELLSSSEELQALNEELETSTEELQSNNEELMCVNDELLDRQEQLISMRNYAESVVKTIREPLIILDKDFVIKSGNPAFYKYFNTTENEIEGNSLFEIGNCQWEIPEFRELLQKVLPEQTNVTDFKMDLNCKGIGKKTMIINARRIIDSKPSELILMAIEDITDVVVANESLMTKNDLLQNYNDQLQTFSSAASHDLQEPLRKIHMFCNMIIDGEKDLSEASRHHLERMTLSIENMRQLIIDLIGYTRISIQPKDFKKTDLNLVLKKTITDIHDLITEKEAIVRVSPMPMLNILAPQIQQLFTNLIINAIKYSKADVKPEITIETAQPTSEELAALHADPEKDYIKIKVSDNGIGFSKEHAERIFDPFYRLHSKDEYRGSGLGLTLSKKIVSNHEGFINAISKVNHGTAIEIFLPV
jgi:two-component system CheB/CheR fusion protein